VIFDVLFFPVTSIAWIGKQIHERATAELDEKENLQKRLVALQLAFDLGEIAEEDFEREEEALLLAIEAEQAAQEP
jgi:hypothetical protein